MSSEKMGRVNIMNLINSIKIRPALYNKQDTMYYSNKKFKFKLWREVCQDVYKNWNDLSPQEKLEHARELQKRWRSLRTCFAREMSMQRKERLKRERNEHCKKRKKYEYFNSLIFLLNPENAKAYDTKDSDSEEDPLDHDTRMAEYSILDAEDEDSDQDVNAHDNLDNYKASTSSEIKHEAPFLLHVEHKQALDNKFLEEHKEKNVPENDEDRMFVLSLVSIFKNLSSRKKMEARIEVLKLLQNITYRDDDQE